MKNIFKVLEAHCLEKE